MIHFFYKKKNHLKLNKCYSCRQWLVHHLPPPQAHDTTTSTYQSNKSRWGGDVVMVISRNQSRVRGWSSLVTRSSVLHFNLLLCTSVRNSLVEPWEGGGSFAIRGWLPLQTCVHGGCRLWVWYFLKFPRTEWISLGYTAPFGQKKIYKRFKFCLLNRHSLVVCKWYCRILTSLLSRRDYLFFENGLKLV